MNDKARFFDHILKNYKDKIIKVENLSVCIDRENDSVLILCDHGDGGYSFYEIPQERISFLLKCGNHCHDAKEMTDEMLKDINNVNKSLN